MMVVIPVLVAFDCFPQSSTHHRDVNHAAGKRVFSMRYDTTDTDKLAAWCLQYPPPENAHWIDDAQGVLFDLITGDADKAITRRAEADPGTYAVPA